MPSAGGSMPPVGGSMPSPDASPNKGKSVASQGSGGSVGKEGNTTVVPGEENPGNSSSIVSSDVSPGNGTVAPSVDSKEEDNDDNPDEQDADDDAEAEDVSPGIFCSTEVECSGNQYCNFDNGSEGECEACGDYESIDACDDSGLPTDGAVACKAKCFTPPGVPTVEPTAEPTEPYELIWPPQASEWVNETFRGFKYPTVQPTLMPNGEVPRPNSTCYMFGLICAKDLEEIGLTSAPTSTPTAVPTNIDGEKPPPNEECSFFGLICPPTHPPTEGGDTGGQESHSSGKGAEDEETVPSKKTQLSLRSKELPARTSAAVPAASNVARVKLKITPPAKVLSKEELIRDQENSAYFEDENENREEVDVRINDRKSVSRNEVTGMKSKSKS